AEYQTRQIANFGHGRITSVPAPHSLVYFLRNEHPSVSRALPPVGWHSTCEHPAHTTTVWACEKTVVMVKQPGHLTSMKKLRGPDTSVCGAELLSRLGIGPSAGANEP